MADNVRLLHGKLSGLDDQPIVGGKVYFAISDEGKGKIYFDVPGHVMNVNHAVRIEMNDEVNFANRAEKDAVGNDITSYLKTLTQNGNKVIGTSYAGDSQEVQTIPFIVGAHTSSTNVWTGSTNAITELYDGLTILYYLPYKGNGQAVTLNLGLGSSFTGAIPCYYKASEPLKNHYDSGTVLLLTYRKNATAQGQANAVTGWFANAQFDDGNTEIVAYKKSSGTYPILGSETSLANIATTGTGTEGVVSATEISMTPATGTIKATNFDGTATRAIQDGAGQVIASTYVSDIQVEKGDNNEHKIIVTKGGQDNSFSLSDIDTHVHARPSATTKAYLMGSETTEEGSKTAVIDPNIYTTTTSGELVASQFTGSLKGNAETATKATQDASGNVITSTYIKTISLDGETVKVAKGTGSATTAFTIPDKQVNVTLDTDTKAYLLGTTTTPTASGARSEAVTDSGVYLSTTPGELVANTFKGNLSGTASRATVADKADEVAWGDVTGKPNPVISITDEDNTISYKTFDGTDHEIGTYAPLDSNGLIPLDYIPQGAREELKVYNSLTAIQTAITSGDLQVGDTALDNSEGIMYFIYNNNGTITYQEYKAGKASSVDWGDIQNRPDLVTNVALDSTKTKITVTKEGATTTLTPSFLPLTGGTVSGKTTFNDDVVLSDITISDGSISNSGEIEINGLTVGASGAEIAGTLSTSGTITAPKFSGVADKAIADEGGQDIRDTYIAGITSDATRAGTTLTYVDGKGNGTTVKVEDPNVTQTLVDNNANYPILMGASAQTATTTGKAYFDSSVTVNPSTNTINANISGTAANATNAETAEFADKATGDTTNIRDKYIASVQSNATSGTKIDFYNGAGTLIDTVYAADTKTDTKNTAGASDTSEKIFLIGAESQGANPQTYSHDTVFVDENGILNANIKGDLDGNATSATKATNDGANQNIADTYIKDATVNGKVITFTKGDGDTFTITTQDTTTDVNVAQTVTSSGTYPLLLSNKTDGATGTTTARFDSEVTLNTSTNTISANITGNAATADHADEADQADKGLINFEDVTKTSDNGGVNLEFVRSNGETKNVYIEDRFVKQEPVTSGEFPLLFAQSNSEQTNITYFNSDITVDIDTNTIGANISGFAAIAGQAENATKANLANENFNSITQDSSTVGVHSFTISKPNGEKKTITFTDLDTKDTVGNQNTEEKMYLVGALSQGSATQTHADSFTNSQVFVEDGAVYSEGKKVLIDGDLTWDNLEGKPADYIQTITKTAAATTKDTNLAIEWKDESGTTTKWSPNFLPASGGTVSGSLTVTGTITGNLSGKATTAGTADTANSVAWGNVSNKPQLIQDVSFDTTTNELKETIVGGSATTVVKLPSLDTNNKIPTKFIPTATTSAIGGTKVYTATGSATDGTMTQKAITDAISSAETQATSAATTAAKSYTDQKIDDLVGEGASTALDTIGEISKAIEENQDILETLNDAIGTKANASDLTAHINDKDNPHDVSLAQLGVTITAANLNTLDDLTANRVLVSSSGKLPVVSSITTTELGYLDNATGNIQTQINTNKTNISTNATNLANHIADKDNPHEVTLSQLGLTKDSGRYNKLLEQVVYYLEDNKTTTAGAWLAKHDDITAYYEGLIVGYKLTIAGASTTTLNINGLGAKTVYRNGTSKVTTHYPVGSIIMLIYDGAAWQVADYDSNTNTYVRQYHSSTNAEYPLLSRYNTTEVADGSYKDEYARFDADVTLNPSTGTIKATTFKGSLDGVASSANANFASVTQSGSTLTFTTTGGATKSVTLPNDNTDTKVTQTAVTTGSYPLLLAAGATTATTTSNFDSDVKLDTSNNTISANISGNAATATEATKASQDAAGRTFTTKYVGLPKNEAFNASTNNALSMSGRVLTAKSPDGSTIGQVTIPDENTDTKVNVAARGTTKAYLLGTSTSPTSSAQAVTALAETGVYLDTTAGKLIATEFAGKLTGNADTATKATQDIKGNPIASTYFSDVAVSGKTLTFKTADGNEDNYVTITTQDTDTKATHTADTGSTAIPILMAGTTTTGTAAGVKYNTGITITPSTGTVTATTFKGALSGKATSAGTADSATKATNDASNQAITGYIRGLSISGKTITWTKGDGTTGTLTTQDTNTDVNVTQTVDTYSGIANSGSGEYKLLFTPKGQTATATTTSTFNNDVKLVVNKNSSGVITKTLQGIDAFSGKATSASSADTAAKATNDKLGSDITGYVKSVSRDKNNLVITNGAGTATNIKLSHTEYDYTEELAMGGSGNICIGKFSMYDTNITANISSTTNITYNGTLVIATQNYGKGGAGTFKADVYGDPSGTISSNIFIYNDGPSGVVEVYFKPAAYSKNLVHVQCMKPNSTPTDVLTSITTIPTNATTKPANVLQSSFLAINGNAATATHATTADSANSVEWDNVIGKPGTVITSISGSNNTSLSWTSHGGSAGSWNPSFLPLTGGTLSGNVTAPKFIGALQGNADSATNATNAANVPWGGVSNKPQLVQEVAYDSSTGYLTKTLVGGSAANLVKVATLDTNGLLPIGVIPKEAQERVLVVADDAAKNALTTNDVQVGDVVKVTSTGLMYYVTGASGTTPTYQEFVAGNAAHASTADRATVAEKDTTDAPVTRYFADASSSATSGTAITFTRGDGSSKVVYAANTDTKNTAGSTNTSSKIFLIGATSQAANPQTYSHDTVYVNTDGNLVSPTFVGALSGNASSATKATYDAGGTKEVADYIYEGVVNSNILTLKSGKGTEKTVFSVTDRDGKLTAQAWTAGTTAGPVPTFTITNTTYTGNTSTSVTATVTGAAIPIAATNASGVVNTSTQSFAGQKTFAATTASTNKDSGAVIVKGGLGVNGRASSNEVMVGDKAVIKYNGDIVALEFTFE